VKLEQLVFIDEFGAATNMTRLRARGPVGQRIVCKQPHGHWKLISTIAAMSACGITSACCFDGATDTEMFVTYVREFLLPTLKSGQVVVLDNLSPHKSPRVDALVESAGARVLRLPPYSPDYNPIEMAISKIKASLRKQSCRSVDALIQGIAEATSSITPQHAIHFIKHRKYATNE
jgi:transposase